MYCQSCGAKNLDSAEFCARCQNKLLVVSGVAEPEDSEASPDEDFSFDEHLLERISVLEEVARRTADSVQHLAGVLGKQERSILIQQAGLTALRELLERAGLVGQEEWGELWKARMDDQFRMIEKRDRFGSLRDRMVALFRGDQRQRFLQHLDEADYALAALDLDRAVANLQAAFKLDPGNYELASFLGETAFGDGELEQALTYFEAALQAKPGHYEALVYSGVIAHERGDPREAEGRLLEAVERYRTSFLPTFSLGAVYAEQERYEEAAAYLEGAVEIEPLPQALYLLGHCYFELGKSGLAIDELRRALRADPGFEEAYHLLGLAYLERRWNRKALEAFRQALRLNPKRLQYQTLVKYLAGADGSPLPPVEGAAADWYRKGEAHLEANRIDRALVCYRRALGEDSDNPTLLMSYAMLCLATNRNREIRPVVQKVLASHQGELLRATAYATLIEALRGEGKYREGNRLGERMLKEGRSAFAQSIAYYEMAYNLAEMEEDLDRALEYARKALEVAPEELRQFPLAALGWVHYKRRELEEAIDHLSRSSELAPSATVLTHLGMALLAAGQGDQARTVMARARQLKGGEGALGEKMMECLKDSTRLLERVQESRRR